jgi:glycosyltransferase involved in cell wall biosynthesis
MSQAPAAPSCLRIAHVDSERGFSGGEVQVFLLLEGLRRLGHETILISPPGSRSADEAKRRAIEHTGVRMRNDLDLPAALGLARIFRRAGVQLVHLHTGRAAWLGGLAARIVKLPAVSSRRMDRRVKRSWRNRILYRHLLQSVIAISPAVVDCLRAAGVPAERIRLIPEGVEVGRLQATGDRAAIRSALGAGADDTVLLALAALVRRKGLDVLLKALALIAGQGLRPIVWIAGDGPEGAALARQVERLGLGGNVRLLGRRSDAADLLAACDVFVLPSRREGLGVSALEAMAAGRPVVASAVGGLSYSVVEGRTGLLVPPENPRALAAALARLLQDPELRSRLGAEGPKRVAEGFHAEQMVAAHDRLYREVIEEWTGQVRGGD